MVRVRVSHNAHNSHNAQNAHDTHNAHGTQKVLIVAGSEVQWQQHESIAYLKSALNLYTHSVDRTPPQCDGTF
jgi:hypothetical protein